MLTPRDISLLVALNRYGVLSRPQVQRLCYPTDKDGRIARRRLQKSPGLPAKMDHLQIIIHHHARRAVAREDDVVGLTLDC